MKKLVVLLLTLSMLFGMSGFCVIANDINEPMEYRDDKGEIIPFTRADGTAVVEQHGLVPKIYPPVVVDGVKDDCYDYGLVMNVGDMYGAVTNPVSGTAYAVYDDSNLYVLVECQDDDPFNILDYVTICPECGKQRAQYSKCEHMASGDYDKHPDTGRVVNIWDDDCVELMIDWSNDGSVPSQYRISRSDIASRDYDTWNTGFDGRACAESDVWYAEFAIPLDLSAEGTQLGLNLMIHSQNSLAPYSETFVFINNYNAIGGDLWASDYYDYIVLGGKQGHTVTFMNGEEKVYETTVSYGDHIDPPEVTKAADEYYVYTFDKWVDAEGNAVDLTAVASNITVYATYTATFAPQPETYPDIQDMPGWYAESVEYILVNGIMNGMDGGFKPNVNMSRAMIVTVLYRYMGEPVLEVDAKNSFSDVKDGKWYTNAIVWAAYNGVVNGKGIGKFDPDGDVTRQEFAVILYRFADSVMGEYVGAGRSDISSFADKADIDTWAHDAVKWAFATADDMKAEGSVAYDKTQYITGKGVKDGKPVMAPKANATRAEVATMLYRYMTGIRITKAEIE